MQFKTYLQSKLPLYLALGSLFVLASCGSYQYVGNDNDGIYSSSEVEGTPTTETEPAMTDNAYYKGYFTEKSQKYENIAQDDNVIFTDIDDYEGTYNDATGEVEYTEGYAGWGQNSSNVTINVYDNNWGYGGFYRPWGFNSWGYGYYNPYGFNSWGYGYNNWGWNTGWGYGYNNWGWNSGFGWCAPYSNYGGYYGYNHNNIAYNSTRRGNYISNSGRSGYSRSSTHLNSRNNTTRRNSTVRNSNTTRYNPANSVRSTTRRNTSDVRRPNATIRSNTTRSNTRVNPPVRSTRSNTRSYTPTRSSSNSPSVRSSSPSRSSSSSRSSSRGSGNSSRRGG